MIEGFHLGGKICEDIIDPTLDELVKFDARSIVPCHSLHRMEGCKQDHSVGT